MSSTTTTVVSASGKVLIAGGYLVLDPKYSGLVVSTSSRFYTAIQTWSGSNDGRKIRVRSPQFEGAGWHYSVDLGDGRAVVTASESDKSKNKFVYIALQQSLQLILELKGRSAVEEVLKSSIDVIIAGDNDFYSQRAKLQELNLKPVLSSLAQIPAFSPTGTTLADVHKTGLGSSAALITSLVTALLLHFNAIDKTKLHDLQGEARLLAHNAAQSIHCLAQGKVGSGFDVSSAIFGSHIYKRFEPSVIAGLMSGEQAQILHPTLSPSNKAWNYVVKPFQLPPLTRLMLADVDAGSDTPSLVGKVLKWREAEGEAAHAFWDQLGASNDGLAEALLQLSTLYKEDESVYAHTAELLSRSPASSWLLAASGSVPVTAAFHSAHSYSEDIRRRMREMGEGSGVPIEPPSQAKLLDACLAQPGVIGCGVPGAGGFDAIWVLVLDPTTVEEHEKPVHRVENVWATWTEGSVTPLTATESFDKGVRVEDVENVPGLKPLLSS